MCTSFTGRFAQHEMKMFDVLSQLSVSNIWDKLVIALTHADVVAPEHQKCNLGELNKIFDQKLDRWINAIRSYLIRMQYCSDVDDIPILPTAHIDVNPKHGNLHNKARLQELLYEVPKRANCSLEVVYALAYAVKPARFLGMMRYKLKHYVVPKTDMEAMEQTRALFHDTSTSSRPGLVHTPQSSYCTQDSASTSEKPQSTCSACTKKLQSSDDEPQGSYEDWVMMGARTGAVIGASVGGVLSPIGRVVGGTVGAVVGGVSAVVLRSAVAAFCYWTRKKEKKN